MTALTSENSSREWADRLYFHSIITLPTGVTIETFNGGIYTRDEDGETIADWVPRVPSLTPPSKDELQSIILLFYAGPDEELTQLNEANFKKAKPTRGKST